MKPAEEKEYLERCAQGDLEARNAGYIGAADSALAGNLPLGTGRPVVQAVAQGDDHSLSQA